MASGTAKKIGTSACALALALLIPTGGWLYGQMKAENMADILLTRSKNAERLWAAKDQADLLAKEHDEIETQLFKRQMAVISAIQETLPGIVCWGESITAGVGGEGTAYPAQLQTLLQNDMMTQFAHHYPADFVPEKPHSFTIQVANMGVVGESSLTVAGRNGAIPYVTTEDITIPENLQTRVRIHFESQNGEVVEPLIHGSKGIGSVTIAGVEGTLSLRQAYGEDGNKYAYYFNRTEAGEAVTVPAGTVIETEGSLSYKDHLAIIQLGHNGGYESAEELIAQIKAFIARQNDPERYIVLGLAFGDAEQLSQINAALSAEFGGHFIDLWQYMREDGLRDAGIEPTVDDTEAMEKGLLPVSLTGGASAFNATGYRLVAECIQRKLHELGYFDAIDAALGVDE